MQKAQKRSAFEPGHEGKRHLVPREVHNPHDIDGGTITVMVNIGHSPVMKMHERGQVSDAQAQAGNRYRELWERATIGGSKAIDTTLEPVDGGRVSQPFNDAVFRAHRELHDVNRRLGVQDSALMIAVAAQCMTIREYAAVCGHNSRRGEEYMGQRFRDALTAAAHVWGYIKPKGRRHSWNDGQRAEWLPEMHEPAISPAA
jgi:hypothetical protein